MLKSIHPFSSMRNPSNQVTRMLALTVLILVPICAATASAQDKLTLARDNDNGSTAGKSHANRLYIRSRK